MKRNFNLIIYFYLSTGMLVLYYQCDVRLDPFLVENGCFSSILLSLFVIKGTLMQI